MCSENVQGETEGTLIRGAPKEQIHITAYSYSKYYLAIKLLNIVELKHNKKL